MHYFLNTFYDAYGPLGFFSYFHVRWVPSNRRKVRMIVRDGGKHFSFPINQSISSLKRVYFSSKVHIIGIKRMFHTGRLVFPKINIENGHKLEGGGHVVDFLNKNPDQI